jgi:hypothetical protein
MTAGLPISKLIALSVSLATPAAQGINFNSLLIVGDSTVINTKDRLRPYTLLGTIATDFGTNASEYLAAKDYFAQQPQPSTIYIGRWAKTSTKGLIVGGALTAAQQLMTSWQAVVNGGFKIAVDGGALTNVTGLNFSALNNLNAVAAAIQTAIQALGGAFAGVTCVWNPVFGQFTITSGTAGPTSAVAALTAPVANADISGVGFLQMTAATASEIVGGIVAESALTAVTILDSLTTAWYGLTFAAGAGNADIADSDHLAIAGYVEASANPHIYGGTTSEAAALVQPDTTSIGAQLKALGYNRTGFVYSSMDPFAVASAFGRLLTVNYQGSNTAITLAWKQLPGVAPEVLTSSQSAALDANNYTYYAAFNNNTSIVVNSTVASGHFFDEIMNVDALANTIQTGAFNQLLTTPTKIPQTDSGMNTLATGIEASCQQFVNNGVLGPGTWNSAGFGQLATGDYLANSFYVYAPPIANQAQAARSARVSVPFQIAAKLAGAVHDVQISLTVNQ